MSNEIQKIVDKISEDLRCEIEKKKEELLKEFPAQLAYDFLTNYKHKWVKDEWNPWDNSGEVVKLPGYVSFDVNDYKTVGCFFEEYVGRWEATYITGSGKHHITHGDEFNNWFEEELREKHYSFLNGLDINTLLRLSSFYLKIDNIEEFYDIQDLVNSLCEEIEEFEDNASIKAYELSELVSSMDFKLIFKQGENDAILRIKEKEKKIEELREKEKVEKQDFEKKWLLLEKKYRLALQKPFPKKIEMNNFSEFNTFLERQNVTQEEKRLISKYAPISFSNSVRFELSK